MNSFHILMTKIPLRAQNKGGEGRIVLLANAVFFPLLTLQPNRCKVQEHAAGEGAELLGITLTQEHALSTAGEQRERVLTMDCQHRLLPYHPPGQLMPRIKIALVLQCGGWRKLLAPIPRGVPF